MNTGLRLELVKKGGTNDPHGSGANKISIVAGLIINVKKHRGPGCSVSIGAPEYFTCEVDLFSLQVLSAFRQLKGLSLDEALDEQLTKWLPANSKEHLWSMTSIDSDFLLFVLHC